MALLVLGCLLSMPATCGRSHCPSPHSLCRVLKRCTNGTRGLTGAGGEPNLTKGGEPLVLPAGGTLTLVFSFTPRAESNVQLQQLSLFLGAEPCAICLSLPLLSLVDEEQTTEPPALLVTPPLPKLTIDLSHNVRACASIELATTDERST